uniref:Sodium/solute symporter n=2 Tax=Clastoptera arizonana TaxID=38151 RepID=A0A1B6CVL2_9HEMI
MIDWIEYLVFFLMLGSSILTGIYFGFFKKQNTITEYMQGGKKMGVFPVTMSLIASHISGVALLGLPAEVYTYGTQFTASVISVVLVTIFTLWTVLPVFFHLKLTSTYQYLELRFSAANRMMASIIFALTQVASIPIVIYIPALVFNQVTGLQSELVALVICVLCISYTTLGGLKAVVWTDTIQSCFTTMAVIAVAVIGCYKQGMTEVWQINQQGHRLEIFNMDPSPFARNTFWTTVLGYSFFWLGVVTFHPGSLQRFTAVPSYKDAQKVSIWSSFGFIVVKIFCAVVGLLIYAKFHDCDPLSSNAIKKSGQLVPYYIITTAGKYPGITGLFISGIVSGALGVMSAGLNTVAGTLYQDFAQVFLTNKKLTESQSALAMKIIVIVLGCISVFLLFLVDKFDSITQITISVFGITYGAITSMFILGLFFPFANSKGAMIGCLTSIIVMGWIVIGAQLSITKGKLLFPGKVTNVDKCPFNITSINARERVQTYKGVGSLVVASEDVWQVYKLSYGYYCLVGTVIGTIVGVSVSLLTKPQNGKSFNPDLIVPFLHKYLQKNENRP